jgi:hypothetical protein
LKVAGAWLLIAEAPVTERRHQFETPQDTSGRNFVPKCDLKRYSERGRICSWNRDNSFPGILLADFAPLGGAWCCFGRGLRLKGG